MRWRSGIGSRRFILNCLFLKKKKQLKPEIQNGGDSCTWLVEWEMELD